MKNVTLVLVFLGFSAAAWGQSYGGSSYPLRKRQRYVSADVVGVLSDGGGIGLQAKYTECLRPGLVIGGGFGFSDGERAHRIFTGVDYELYPDYMNQPKVSIGGFAERALEFSHSHTRFGIAPTLSKGFSFWGQEGFPFMSLPVALDLNGDTRSYAVATRVVLGASFPVPAARRGLLVNVEVNMDVGNSYSGVFFGFSHPL